MKKINNKGFGIIGLFGYLLIFFTALFIITVLVNQINKPVIVEENETNETNDTNEVITPN